MCLSRHVAFVSVIVGQLRTELQEVQATETSPSCVYHAI